MDEPKGGLRANDAAADDPWIDNKFQPIHCTNFLYGWKPARRCRKSKLVSLS